MFEFDELIMLPLNESDRHVDIGQIAYRVIGFGLCIWWTASAKGANWSGVADNWA